MADPDSTLDGSSAAPERNVDAFLHTLEMTEDATLVRAPLSTIEPKRPDTDAARKAGALLAAEPRSTRVRIEQLLGEGGMGVVYLAEQESLGRKVAVKQVRADARSPTSITRLLQEAWVIGQLEHPNILPVYDIAASDDGDPLIVLKRIEGVEWGQLMHDGPTVQRRFRAPDLLEWNLDVMARVCDAVHFAHSRGFIHRDIKPENVLIGELGEVYLADWGIAVSTRDDQRIVPHARDAKDIAGTPAYMAPEMLGGEVSRISEKTDVYLLGGVLFELLGGHPPHQGKDLREMITSILMDVRELPDTVPAALRAITARALAVDPDARFESPLQLRLALEGYLRHRGSERIAARALERLAELEVCLGSAQAAPEDAQQLHGLVSECRFGFREALAQWPENNAARAGLQRTLELVVAHAARNGDPKAARAYLSELDSPGAELVALVAAAEAELAEREGRLAELEKHHDLRTGMRTRTLFAAILGGLWTAAPILGGAIVAPAVGYDMNSYTPLYVVPTGCLFLVLGLGYWARESMTATPLNLRFFLSIVALLVLQPGLLYIAQSNGLPLSVTFSLLFAYWTSLSCMAAITMHAHLSPMVVGYGVATALSLHYPDHDLWIMSGGNFVFMLTLLYMGLPVLREDHERRAQQRRATTGS
ncbi:MAG: serine/threonine protein kinase [Sandaracinaceae bacterium]|nr:serine/threonine protein kinase [Sandaracinaceae bacterium]